MAFFTKVQRLQACFGLLCLLVAAFLSDETRADVIFSIDLDPAVAGIQNTRNVTADQVISAAISLQITGTTKVSGYGVSTRFDATELLLQSYITSPPTGWFEIAPATTTIPSAVVDSDFGSTVIGQINSINASNFAGYIDSSFSGLIGSLSFKVAAPVSNGSVDIAPGFYVSGIDGLNDENGFAITSGVVFQGAHINVSAVPEPAACYFLFSAAAIFFVRRRSHLI